jgi:hypothetical protein
MRDPTKGVEKVITEAQQEGKFTDLPGKGKPLVIDTSPDAVVKGLLKEANVSLAPEWARLAGDIDRLLEEEQQLLQRYAATYASDLVLLSDSIGNQSSTPESSGQTTHGWTAIARRIFRRHPSEPPTRARAARSLSDAQRQWDRSLERYAALLHDMNRKIRRFNQLVPLTNRQRTPLAVKERLEAFIERFPRLALAEDGAVRPERSLVPPSLLVPPPEPEVQDPAMRKRAALEAVALQRARRREPPPIG